MTSKLTTQEKDVDPDTLQEAELSVQYVALRKQLDISEEVIAKKSDVIQQQQSRIQQLEELLRLRTVEKYASSSESNPLQERMVFNDVEQLADEAEAEAAAESGNENKGNPAKPRPKRKGLNPEIPRVQQRALLTDEQREGAIDTFFVTVKEELDITPAKVQVIEHLQEKAVYLDDEGNRCVREATRPKHPLGKSVASVALLAYLIIAKYMDGLPLYRLEGILKRYGGSINRSTMAGWLIRLSLQLQCVVNLLQEVQLTADYLQGDETRQQVLKEPGKDPTSDKWVWVIRGGPPDKPVVFFHYDKSRGGAVAQQLLEGFCGRYYQCDGYAGQKMAVGDQYVTIVGCMDHARRGFTKAEKALPKEKKKGAPAKCTVARTKIDALYRIEREMDKLGLSVDERYEYRQKHAMPKLKELHKWLVTNESKVAKDTLTHKAIKYTLNQWEHLIAYCDHGQLHISNILVENAIRPFAVGRRAWLFSDTPKGAKAGAVYYTLIESAKANGLDPYAYLLHLCKNIADVQTVEDVEALLPWNVTDQLNGVKSTDG